MFEKISDGTAGCQRVVTCHFVTCYLVIVTCHLLLVIRPSFGPLSSPRLPLC